MLVGTYSARRYGEVKVREVEVEETEQSAGAAVDSAHVNHRAIADLEEHFGVLMVRQRGREVRGEIAGWLWNVRGTRQLRSRG